MFSIRSEVQACQGLGRQSSSGLSCGLYRRERVCSIRTKQGYHSHDCYAYVWRSYTYPRWILLEGTVRSTGRRYSNRRRGGLSVPGRYTVPRPWWWIQISDDTCYCGSWLYCSLPHTCQIWWHTNLNGGGFTNTCEGCGANDSGNSATIGRTARCSGSCADCRCTYVYR